MKRAERHRAPATTLVALFAVLPIVYLALLSVTRTGAPPRVLPAEWRLDAWRFLLSGRGEMLRSLWVSLALSAAVALSSAPLGFVAARYVAFHRHRRLLLFFAYMPFVLSPVILGTCMLFFYIRAGLSGSLAGVFLAQTVFTFGFSIVFFLSFWNREKLDLEDLVATLGGTRPQFYRLVLLPISRDALRTGMFQIFLLSWFQYGLTILIGEGGVRTLPVLVYAHVAEANPLFAAAAGMLLVLPPLALLAMTRRPPLGSL